MNWQNGAKGLIVCLSLTGAVCPVQAGESADALIEDQAKHSLTWKQTPRLVSRFADGLLLKTPLPEYPRPQLVREDWLNLNGEWDFLGDGPVPPELPVSFPEKALVPSATDAATSCLRHGWVRGWYRKTIQLPDSWDTEKLLLHFESVGGIATVYFNSEVLGSNTGSYKRFSFEVNDVREGENEVLVYFDDSDPRIARGKPGRLSGIWLTVWAEPVPAAYIRSCRQTPDIDAGQLAIDVEVGHAESDLTVAARASASGVEVAGAFGSHGERLLLDIPNQKLWSPGHPFLYDLVLELKRGDVVVDRVESYFGMRKGDGKFL